MFRHVLVLAVLVTLGETWSVPLRAQAAASYAVAASKSTAIGAKARPLVTPKASPLSKRNLARTSPTFVDVLQQNREKLEAKSGPSGGSLHVESLPGKATVSVDGAPVAHTPADLKLAEGNHVVELTLPGFLPWRKNITISREGTMLLKAELHDQYKSAVTFSRFK
ncbi:MAG: PEGA domain-containing protein [Terriglobales bacterium]